MVKENTNMKTVTILRATISKIPKEAKENITLAKGAFLNHSLTHYHHKFQR